MFAANRLRMKIQTEQNKPHRNQTSIAQEFTVSFTTDNIWCYNSLHRKEFECMGYEFESSKWIRLYLTESLTQGLPINIRVQIGNSLMTNNSNNQ